VKDFENRSIFGEAMDKSIVSRFFDSQCSISASSFFLNGTSANKRSFRTGQSKYDILVNCQLTRPFTEKQKCSINTTLY